MNIHLLNTRIEAINVQLKSKELSNCITPEFMSISMLAIENIPRYNSIKAIININGHNSA